MIKRLLRAVYWAPRDVGLLVRSGFPQWVVYCGGYGYGDDLLLTPVLEEIRRRGGRRIAVISRLEEIFRNGPREIRFVNDKYRLLQAARKIGARVVHAKYLLGSAPEYDVPSTSHLITEMCRSVGLSGSIDIRPYFYLSDAERAGGSLGQRQAVIQCADPASAPHAPLKHWRREGYQGVVDLLKGELDFIQLGSTTDPLLEGVIDLRGKTTIRQSAAILANSRVNIGYVGFLMHLARAVECRSVVVFGGRERPDQSGYAANENLFTPLPCSPCWRRYSCLRELDCMLQISPDNVVAATRRALVRGGEPLCVERAHIPEGPEPFTLPWRNTLA